MEATIRDVDTPAGRVRVELRGQGPIILLLHGLSAHRRTWDPVARRLEGRFGLCLPDLPGRGESEPRPELAHGLGEELRRLRALLDRVGLAPRIVVGHSQGAALAAALAAADRRVQGLVLTNPVTPWTRRPGTLSVLRHPAAREAVATVFRPLRRPLARCILERTYGPNRATLEEDVRRYAEPYADPARARLLLRLLADWEPAALERHLPDRPLAGWVLAGARDRRVGLREPARLAARLGLEFAAVRGVGHVLPEEAPERVERAVLEVSAGIDAPGDPPGRVDRRTAS